MRRLFTPKPNWRTGIFSAPVGRIDIYSVCTSHGAAKYTIYARPAGGGNTASQAYTFPCDARGRWLSRVGIPANTPLEVRAVAKAPDGTPCLFSNIIHCATGYASVWSSG